MGAAPDMSLLDGESGLGMVELLIAMVVTSIGIMALVAGFSSGHEALERAHTSSSAASIAEKRMETYRSLRYASIPTCSSASAATTTCSDAVATETAGDGRTYRVEVSYTLSCPVGTPSGTVGTATCTGSATPTKLVRIVVKNQANTKTLFTQATTFTAATG